jgi:hypothetical protein
VVKENNSSTRKLIKFQQPIQSYYSYLIIFTFFNSHGVKANKGWLFIMNFYNVFFNEITHFFFYQLCCFFILLLVLILTPIKFTHSKHYFLSSILKLGSSIKIPNSYNENDWSNFIENIIFIDDEKWEEDDVEQFIRLV